MKKVLALFLTALLLVTLFPLSLSAQAETVSKKDFYLVNWSEPEGNPQYIFGMPGSWVNTNKVGTGTTAEDAPVSVSGSDNNVQAAAKKMYDMLSQCPAGARYFNFAAQRTLFLARCKDLVDIRHGVELTKNWITALLTEYKALGGELDGILVDFEYNGAYTHYIDANNYSKKTSPNKEIYNQLAANEYYLSVMRPVLVERGFVFYDNPDPEKYPYRSELWTLENCSEDGADSVSKSLWNQLVQELHAEAMTEAVYEPLIQFYPNAVVSDYKTGDSHSWFKGMGHTGSQSGYNTVKAGNASNYNFYDYATGYLFYGYGSESNRTQRKTYQKPASYNDAYFADAPYSRTNWEVNTMKRLLASTDTGKVNAWITFFNYGTYGPGYSRTPYYSELIYHLGMTNPEPFIGYILKNEVLNKGYDDPNPDVCEYDYNLKVVDELMAELTRVAGYSDRKAIITPITWNEGFFYSGMYANGRNIWRLTPDTGEISVKDFKVKDNVPTFTVNGVTITFPQGKILQDSPITHVGTCGYWIETPADVIPVVTSSASRYKNDPSFYDGFDYAAGAFTSNSVLPDTFWTVSGSAAIGKGEGMSWLELSGNASVTNTKVPQLITAGDYYAKQQRWEIEVHLAPSLGDYGDITLLSAGNGDGGVKISGGKVYYDEAGTYKEIKGVTLGDGFYIVKRDMDFRTEGAYTCCYTIWDNVADKAIAIIDDVPIAIQKIPVTDITISVSGASHKVTFDDYKLYPTGITANLDLYDAKYGRKLTDPTAAQAQDVGYRLSWMNASSQYKVARIYDVKTGTTVQTVEMDLGMDGVVTGIVPGSAENPVQLAVEIVDKADLNPETPPPTEDAGQGSTPGTEPPAGGNTSDVSTVGGADAPDNVDVQQKSGSKTLALILSISLAVVVAGAIVFFFVIKPKKRAKKPKETTEE